MRKIGLIFALVATLIFTSCKTSTVNFNSYPYNSPDVEIEVKMEAAGVKPSKLDIPTSYFDAKEFLEEYINIINNTEDYLLMSTFLGSYGPGLEELYAAIAKKAQEGVRVYLIIDGLSSIDMTITKEFMTPLYFLRDYGVNLVEYNPLSGLRFIAPQTLLVRDHRKTIVSDGKISIVGGMNMNYISLGAEDEHLQRDSMYVFESKEFAADLVDAFLIAWNNASINKLNREDFATYSDDDLEKPLTGYIFNQGPQSDHAVAKLYSSVIGSAKNEIVILPYLPYFDEEMQIAIREAIDRGVNVKMYFPIDSREYIEGALYYCIEDLYDLGMEIYYERLNEDVTLLHEKLMVVDGEYSIIGSANFNLRSMALSHEICLLITGEEFASSSLQHVEELTKEFIYLDEETAREWKRDGNFVFYLMGYIGG